MRNRAMGGSRTWALIVAASLGAPAVSLAQIPGLYQLPKNDFVWNWGRGGAEGAGGGFEDFRGRRQRGRVPLRAHGPTEPFEPVHAERPARARKRASRSTGLHLRLVERDEPARSAASARVGSAFVRDAEGQGVHAGRKGRSRGQGQREDAARDRPAARARSTTKRIAAISRMTRLPAPRTSRSAEPSAPH